MDTCAKPLQTFAFDVEVNVHEEPLLDEYDRRHLPEIVSEAVQAAVTEWAGGGTSATCSLPTERL